MRVKKQKESFIYSAGFEFQLPSNLAPSLRHRNASIIYTIEAVPDISESNGKITANGNVKEIQIVSRLPESGSVNALKTMVNDSIEVDFKLNKGIFIK